MTRLNVVNLTKVYPDFTLKDISFSIDEGEVMGLIGRNGAGKSTTLKSILNLIHPTSGSIQFCGKEIAQHEIDCKQEIGAAFGEINFYEQKKLAQITEVTKRFYSNWDCQIYQQYCEQFQLNQHKKVKELSTGMRVKYMVALALSHDAKLLILDEPTSGLDPVSRNELLEIFQNLAQKGKSILFSTHITSDLEKVADSITYLHNGRLVKSASKATFINGFQALKKPNDPTPMTLDEIMIRTEGSDQYE